MYRYFGPNNEEFENRIVNFFNSKLRSQREIPWYDINWYLFLFPEAVKEYWNNKYSNPLVFIDIYQHLFKFDGHFITLAKENDFQKSCDSKAVKGMMQHGMIIKMCNSHGFILPSTCASKEIYFSASSLQDGIEFSDLMVGLKVKFDTINFDKCKKNRKLSPEAKRVWWYMYPDIWHSTTKDIDLQNFDVTKPRNNVSDERISGVAFVYAMTDHCGYIADVDSSEIIFFHRKNVVGLKFRDFSDMLGRGDKVYYEAVPSKNPRSCVYWECVYARKCENDVSKLKNGDSISASSSSLENNSSEDDKQDMGEVDDSESENSGANSDTEEDDVRGYFGIISEMCKFYGYIQSPSFPSKKVYFPSSSLAKYGIRIKDVKVGAKVRFNSVKFDKCKENEELSPAAGGVWYDLDWYGVTESQDRPKQGTEKVVEIYEYFGIIKSVDSSVLSVSTHKYGDFEVAQKKCFYDTKKCQSDLKKIFSVGEALFCNLLFIRDDSDVVHRYARRVWKGKKPSKGLDPEDAVMAKIRNDKLRVTFTPYDEVTTHRIIGNPSTLENEGDTPNASSQDSQQMLQLTQSSQSVLQEISKLMESLTKLQTDQLELASKNCN